MEGASSLRGTDERGGNAQGIPPRIEEEQALQCIRREIGFVKKGLAVGKGPARHGKEFPVRLPDTSPASGWSLQ